MQGQGNWNGLEWDWSPDRARLPGVSKCGERVCTLFSTQVEVEREGLFIDKSSKADYRNQEG